MALKQEHIDYIRTAICANSKAPTLHSYKEQGLTTRLWVWDLLLSANISKWVYDNIYPYANDEELDTALHCIMGVAKEGLFRSY